MFNKKLLAYSILFLSSISFASTQVKLPANCTNNCFTYDANIMVDGVSGTAISSTNPLPVSASVTPPSDYTATGNITAANSNLNSGTATANSTVVTATMSGVSTADISVTGTFSATLYAQVSVDNGTTWASLNASTAITNLANGTQASSITVAGNYQVAIPAAAKFRITAQAYTSGTAVVSIRASTGVSASASSGGGGGGTQYAEGATTTPGTGNLSLCRYLSSGNTLTNTQLWTLACDVSNNLLVNVTTSALPAGAATAANQTTANSSLSTIATNTTGVATAANQTTMNTNLSSIVTNTTGAATAANQTNGTQLARITNGTQTADTVAGDSNQSTILTGVGRKTITLTAATTTQTIDMLGYSSFSVVVSAISGTWSAQQSNDGTTYIGKFVDPTSNTSAVLTTSLTTTTGYESAITSRYLRITGGTSITASIVLSTAAIPPKVIGVNGTVSATQSGTFTVQPSNTANTTPWLQTMIPVVSPLSSSSPNEASVSTAYEASHVVKASAGVLYSLLCYNSKASDQFVETFNSTTLPADTTVSITVPMLCRAGSNCTLDFAPFGKYYSTGIVWSNSSTSPTKTIGSADMFCEPRYQ